MKLNNKKIKNALISVFNKSNIVEFTKKLLKNKIKVFTTGGTAKILKQHNIKINSISEITNYPEILDGQIKTIHPKIFSGILGNKEKYKNTIKNNNIIVFDMIIVNFYTFNYQENNFNIKKNIDIGGPSLVRAAAKNYKNVVVVTDVLDYKKILEEIKKNGFISIKTKLQLAYKAFKYTKNYDNIIKKYFYSKIKKSLKKKENTVLPETIIMKYKKQKNLKYGENPHQKASFYILNKSNILDPINDAIKINCSHISYNNIEDTNTTLECLYQFNAPTCVIVKHSNPCGAATKKNALSAYLSAYKSDPISSFGGIIGFNCSIDENVILKILNTQFVEIIITPEITEKALKIIKKNKKIKLIIYKKIKNNQYPKVEFKSINHGLLMQEKNNFHDGKKKWEIVSEMQPTKEEMQDAIFCWKIVKFVKSNAIVYGKNLKTISIGSGQTSRIDAVKIANMKYNTKNKKKKIIMASDAFFPFKDGIEEAISQGVTCIIQPGGSIKDNEIIETVNKNKICMIFTKKRNFKH